MRWKSVPCYVKSFAIVTDRMMLMIWLNLYSRVFSVNANVFWKLLILLLLSKERILALHARLSYGMPMTATVFLISISILIDELRWWWLALFDGYVNLRRTAGLRRRTRWPQSSGTLNCKLEVCYPDSTWGTSALRCAVTVRSSGRAISIDALRPRQNHGNLSFWYMRASCNSFSSGNGNPVENRQWL